MEDVFKTSRDVYNRLLILVVSILTHFNRMFSFSSLVKVSVCLASVGKLHVTVVSSSQTDFLTVSEYTSKRKYKIITYSKTHLQQVAFAISVFLFLNVVSGQDLKSYLRELRKVD